MLVLCRTSDYTMLIKGAYLDFLTHVQFNGKKMNATATVFL